jgi:hypothetical protein
VGDAGDVAGLAGTVGLVGGDFLVAVSAAGVSVDVGEPGAGCEVGAGSDEDSGVVVGAAEERAAGDCDRCHRSRRGFLCHTRHTSTVERSCGQTVTIVRI